MRALEAVEWFVNRLNCGLLEGAKWLSIICVVLMLGIVNIAVFQRYVMDDALAWSEEIAKFVMVWLTFMSAPIGLKLGAHVGIEAFVQYLKGRARQCLLVLIFMGIIALMYVFITEGWFMSWNARIQTASTIDISIFYVYICMPIGCSLVALVAFEFMLGALKGVIDPTKALTLPSQEQVLTE